MRSYTDAMGRAVDIPSGLSRVVSLVPSITEVLFEFGRGEAVVGITEYCTEPSAEVVHKTRIGGTKNPDLAVILALEPQLVFAVAEENRRDDVAQLESAGVPVYVFEPATVRDGIDLLWRVADILECEEEVKFSLQAIEVVYAETQALVAGQSPVRVFCPIWKDPYMTINAGTYVHDMLQMCGGDNIFAQRDRRFPLAADLGRESARLGDRDKGRDRRYPRVTLDEVATLRPEVILLPDEPYVFSEADLADFLPFTEVPAVATGRIHLIDGKLISWYGPRIGESLQTLSGVIRG